MRKRFAFLFLTLFPAMLFIAGCDNPSRPDEQPPAVSVSISPCNEGGIRIDVPRNDGKEFVATVTVGSVDWSVGGNFHPDTGITPTEGNSNVAFLRVNALELARTLTVTATSQHNRAVYASVTITVTPRALDSVTDVTIRYGNAIIVRGEYRQFYADVTVTGVAPDTVHWKIEGETEDGTYISPAGLLTVAANEGYGPLTVTARSTFDPDRYDSVIVTLVNPGEGVHDITIDPVDTQVQRGSTATFTATIYVVGYVSDAVSWSVEGNFSPDTIIEADPDDAHSATLHVANDESAHELTVRVESTFDGSWYDTATVTLIGEVLIHNIWLVGTMTGWADNFPTGEPMRAGPGGTVIWEGDVETNSTFRFSLTDTTGWGNIWNGHWFAPPDPYVSGGRTVSLDDNLNTMARFETDTSHGATHATRNSWRIPHAGWYRLTVNPDSTPPTLRVERPVIVTGVTVDGPRVVVIGSEDNVFTATVTGRNNPAETVRWSFSGASASGTRIDPDTGILHVSQNETAATLTIRAESTVDASMYDTLTVQVSNVAPLPLATGLGLDATGMASWTWSPPPGANIERFQLQLYRSETDAGPFVSVGSPITANAAVRTHNLAAAMRNAGVGTYRFTVTVISGDTDAFLDSGPSAPSGNQDVTRRRNVENAWWFGSGVARWVNPDGSGDYIVRLYRDGTLADERPWLRGTTENPGNSAETVTTIDFAWQGVSANSAAMYTFTVTALGRSTLELDSAPSAGAGLTPRHFSVMGYTGVYAAGVPARVWAVTEGRRDGNVRYVAGGENGRIAWSEDGITWTLASQGANPTAIFGSNDVRAFAHSPILGGDFGRFVAVGHGGVAARSDDGGATWILMPTGFTYNMLSVAYGNDVFLAGAQFGRIRRSTDGISFGTADLGHWQGTAADPAILNWGHVEAMVFDAAGSRFVAFGGNNADNENHRGQMASTTNGATWDHVANGFVHSDGVMRNVMNVAVSGDGVFVAAFPNNPNLLRSNGLAGSPPWAWHDHQVGNGILAVNFSNGRFISVGTGGNAGISVDGTDWQTLNNSFTGNISAAHRMGDGNVILAGPDRFAVVPLP